MTIHPSAIVSQSARLGAGVDVGPYAIIEDNVSVGDGTRIRARAQLCAGTSVGKGCDIHMNAIIGHLPQDFSHKGEPISTLLGDHVVVRENATIHGSVGATGTLIGDKCYLMVGSHVAHNCKLGKGVLLANGALLAGHVQVGDGAIISGNVVIHQFCRIGTLAILSGGSRIGMDVPPYLIGDGVNTITTLNKVGLRRAPWLTSQDREEIKAAYKVLYRSELDFKDAVERIDKEFSSPAVKLWAEFFKTHSHRGFCRQQLGTRRSARLDAEAESS
ncbi:MAG TPA: acyl-ACP--UDP-N-acetylglucosamine O-acyltransferase [Planctomycetota bacterium]|nr:acyl-ACP--UDP-N-acetylglucosamine O-acyltransferase [Planctomycetota bacterium]